MDKAGVDRVVIVPLWWERDRSSWEGDRNDDDTVWIMGRGVCEWIGWKI
jgi:hypothetical protein